jgi:putative ABC transport system permease protein
MLRHYVAVALRNVRGAPFASAVNVVTLAVGLVCFVTAYAAFKFWDGAEEQFRNADDIYALTVTIRNRAQASTPTQNVPYVPDVAAEALKTDFPAISKIARAHTIDRQLMVASGGRSLRLYGAAVDAEFLEIFDLPFVAGEPTAALSAPRSVVVTRDAAARLFGSDDPLGKTVLVGNAVDATVTGVIDDIREPSQFARSATATLPFDLLASRDVIELVEQVGGPGAFPSGANWFLLRTMVYLYLSPSGGLSADQLSAGLDDFVTRHVPAELLRTNDYRMGLVPVRKMLAGTNDFFGTGLSFAGALLMLGGLVLGVACVNYANLATARAARRVREVGVRKALGASPAQVSMQSLFEAAALTILALLVALAAFVFAQPLVQDLLGAKLGPDFFARLDVWPALAILVLVVTLAAGAYPAFVLSRVRPVTALAVSQARLGSPLFSTLLVGAQFGVASFLLIAVTVISMQNAEVRRSALSAVEDPLVLIENPTRLTKVSGETLRARLATVPQVRGVTELRNTPWESLAIASVTTSPDPSSARHAPAIRWVGYDFFDVFDVPLVAGRVFDREHAADMQPAGAPGLLPAPPASNADAAPINVVATRAFVADLGLASPESAIDTLLYRPPPPFPGAQPQPPFRIVGVVEDRTFSFFKMPTDDAGAIYSLQAGLEIVVARVSAADIPGALAGIDAAWADVAPNVAISRRFMDEVFERAYSRYTRINQVFATLAVMAFAICIAGLFGMAVFVAGRRRREIGVRKTLGGTTSQMVALLLAGFSRPVLVANLVAWPAGYFAARVYLNQFPESIDLTPWPFVLSAAITIAIAWLAVAGQTVRAARATPAEVLRNE